MGSALSVVSVHLKSDLFFFCPLSCKKQKKNFLGVFERSLCVCCKRYLEIVVVLQNRER